MKKKDFSMNNLSQYRGVLMGIQIILIVLFHFTEDCINSGTSTRIVYLFYKYIRSSGVDVFLLLSGLGLYYSWKKNPNLKGFYKRRFSRILIPYFIIAIPAWGWRDLIFQQEGILQFLKDLFFVSLFEEGQTWIWYIAICLICYLAFPYVYEVLEKAIDTTTEKMYVLQFTMAITMLVVMLQLYCNDLYLNISILLLRFPMFIIGCLLGKASYENRTISNFRIWGMLFLAVILSWRFQLVDIKIIRFYVLAFLNVSLSLVFLLALNCVKMISSKRVNLVHKFICNIAEWLGNYSLEIYMCHVVVRKVMNLNGFETYKIANECIMLGISFILTLLLKKVTDVIRKSCGC